MAGHDSPGEQPLRMSARTFGQRQDAGDRPIVLDVRGPKDWDSSDEKIPGALRAYPELRIDPHWPRDRLILTYGTGPQEAASARVALQLREQGFTEAYALLGGFDAWRAAGYPVESKEG